MSDTDTDLYALFGIPRHTSVHDDGTRAARPDLSRPPASWNASRALQSLPAVMTPEDLWAAGFRSHMLRPTPFGNGGWR